MGFFQRLVLALVLSPAFAHAALTASGPGVVYSGNSATVVYGNDFHDLLGRSVKNIDPKNEYASALDRAGSGGVKVSDAVKVNTSRGVVNARITTAVSARAIARGAAVAARAMPAAGVAIGVGSLIWELMDDHRIHPDGNGGLSQDPGVPPSPGVCWSPSAYTAYQPCYSSSSGALTHAFRAYRDSQVKKSSYVVEGVVVACTYSFSQGAIFHQTADSVSQYVVRTGCGSNSPTDAQITAIRGVSDKACGDGTDGKLWPDGRCGTGVYSKPLTNDEVVDAVSQEVADKPDRVPLVTDILGSPGGAIDIDPGSQTTSGPSSATGTPPAPVVVNTPAGPETRTESPAIAIRYRGPEVEWEPKEVTTTRPGPNPGDPDETTVEHAPDEPSADPSASQAPDPCIANPKRAGCSELGDVEDPEWNPDEKPIELKAEAPWGSDNASCPPPRIFSIAGHQIPMEWTLWCQFFAGIRFAVIAGAWVAAVLIFLGGKTE